VLILDEPTTSLTPNEVSRLFTLLRRLRDSGTTIVYVSHRLPEIIELSDLVHVLRDGLHVATFSSEELTTDVLISSMVGRELAAVARDERHELGAPMVEINGLSSATFADVSFSVAAGEIIGFAGLPDSGNSALVAALFGAVPATGEIQLEGRRVRVRSPRDAMRAGIGYVPAERRSQALFPDLSAVENATVLDVDTASRFGLVSHRRLRRLGARRLAEYDVRGSAAGAVTGLSGGNQQKVILSRWLARAPRLLLLDDPTRGVDVGAKSEIHDRLVEAARRGAAVLMASSDLPELLRVCDRIAVLSQGRLTGIVDARTTSETEVMSLATVGTTAGTAGSPETT
jgi:ABC-type sugar transport system ATPase subunit